MSARVRVLAELSNDGIYAPMSVDVEAVSNNEFMVRLNVKGTVTAFNAGADTIRDFRDALSVVLDDESLED